MCVCVLHIQHKMSAKVKDRAEADGWTRAATDALAEAVKGHLHLSIPPSSFLSLCQAAAVSVATPRM